MRIAFAGTPDFAARSLAALIDAAPQGGWNISLVLTQPDRPAGRGLKTTPSPVSALARAHDLPVITPASLRKGDDARLATEQLRSARPDVLVVAAYGLILPRQVLDIPAGVRIEGATPLRALNVHASLLPRWRGAAPGARAIEAGDATTGITLMQMDVGLDTGPMLQTESTDIAVGDTTATLTARLALLGARMLVQALRNPDSLQPRPQPQPSEGVTYAAKIAKEEALLDWTASAISLNRKVRAFDPFPVAVARLAGMPIRVWRADALPQAVGASPGTVVAVGANGIDVACGSGCLRLLELQRPGGRRLPAREFLAGHPIAVQQRFDCGPEHG
jgi:methionyl-tRNA formyltransferase